MHFAPLKVVDRSFDPQFSNDRISGSKSTNERLVDSYLKILPLLEGDDIAD